MRYTTISKHILALFLLAASIFALPVAKSPGTSPSPIPPRQKHFDQVDARGDQGMGFSPRMTGHRFRLLPDGGAIEVEAIHQFLRFQIIEHRTGDPEEAPKT